MFLHLSVILFTEGGVCLSACWDTQPPISRHPPGADTPPREQTPPWEQTPPGAETPLEQTPSWGAETPLGADIPPGAGADTLPLEQKPPSSREQTPPRSRHPLRADTPSEQTPRSRHPHPRSSACWEIRAISGRGIFDPPSAEMYISVSLLPSTYFFISMRDTSRNPTQTDSFKLLYSQELKIIHFCRYRHFPCKLLPKWLAGCSLLSLLHYKQKLHWESLYRSLCARLTWVRLQFYNYQITTRDLLFKRWTSCVPDHVQLSNTQ